MLRRDADAAPTEGDRARALARGYLDLGRRQGEPRLVAYAATVVDPLARSERAQPDDLVLAATAAQYLHDFDHALALLDRALVQQPLHPQALLTRADLLEVRGDYPAARQSCARLAQATAPLIAIACLTSIDSRTGRLADSYSRLRQVYEAAPGLPPEIDVWILGMLAEMAERSGDPEAQRRYLSRARASAPQDLKVQVAEADWHLQHGRPADVLTVDAPTASIGDALLLRLAIAAKRAGDPRASGWANEFRERQRLAEGDARHLREWARFALDVDGDAAAAIRHARENWQHQREPEDLRLLLRAARASGDAAALDEARRWIAAQSYEDHAPA